MDDGIGELAFGQIVAKALGVRVVLRAEIGKVVSYLKEQTHGIADAFEVTLVSAEEKHESNGQAEKTSRF